MNYIKLLVIFLILFISINLELNKVAPPTFNYFFCGLILLYGYIAYRRHQLKYIKTFIMTAFAAQLVFCLAIPYWILKTSMPLNASWPYFPEVLWTTGSLVIWYYIISFAFVPVVVYLYGRRAWCLYICGTGAMAETIGDPFRNFGPKAKRLPGGFLIFKWIALIGSVIITVAALSGYDKDATLNLIFLIIFILFLRTFIMQLVNIMLMPKLGNRIWCKYFCPQGLIIGIISRIGRFALIKDQDLCAGCGTCDKNCSMGISIKEGPSVNKTGECVGCGVCVEMCPQKALSMTSDSSVIKRNSPPAVNPSRGS